MPAQPRTPPPPTRRRNRRQTLHHLRHQRRSPAYPHGRSMHQLLAQMETQTRPRIPQASQRLPTPMATGAPRRIPGNETPLRTQETSEGTSMSVKTYMGAGRSIGFVWIHVLPHKIPLHCLRAQLRGRLFAEASSTSVATQHSRMEPHMQRWQALHTDLRESGR